jgi:hypothetical protein
MVEIKALTLVSVLMLLSAPAYATSGGDQDQNSTSNYGDAVEGGIAGAVGGAIVGGVKGALRGGAVGAAGGAAVDAYQAMPDDLFSGSADNDNSYGSEMSGGEAAGDGVTGGDLGH